ncbi:hypothetical protein [Microbacterium sp. GCS4]|uniref:hypothetical protein n=1 Tax=Microbacterium sp. GCS4 TaxID=1692239 RepID=UPI00067FC841|nr:hypothetical protein [Microbacterium sp. GCS4]KNY07943.1 hypothetical protein AKH00_06935 [Microbacterium sp. GCS4]
MRVLVVVGAFIVILVFAVGGGVLLGTQSGGPSEWSALSAIPTTMYTIAPLILGSSLAFWDPARTASSRRAYRRTLIVTVTFQVLATVALSVYVALTGTAWWVVPVLVVGGIALTAGAVWLGPILRRTEKQSDRSATASEAAAYPRADLRRDVRHIVIAAVIGSAVGAAAVLALFVLLDDGEQPTWEPLVFGLMFGGLSVGIVCVVVVLRLSRQLRDLVDGDADRLKELGKVISRGKKISLSAENEAVAPHFAAVSSVLQTYTLGQLVCVVMAVGIPQIGVLLSRPSDVVQSVLSLVAVVLFGLFLVVGVPLGIVQLHRTRAYALDHGEVIVEPSGTTS